MTNVTALSATALAAEIRAGRVSAREAVAASLARIDLVQPALNAFTLVLADEATAAADRADAAQAAGARLGPLHGVPVAFKDFTPTKGHRTTRGSRCFEHWVPDADPVIVQRFKAAGAILVGKTATPEFAYSSFTSSPLWGHTRNPWDPDKTPGGSSGGAAVATATACVTLAEGTDMGGSVRIPAGCCGCVGLKPSLGRIPMDILATGFDDMSHFGPLARAIDDAALFLRVAEGPDDADPMSQRVPTPLPERFDTDLHGVRLALSVDLGFYAVSEPVRANLLAAAEALQDAGAEIEEVALDWTPATTEDWYTWWGAFQAAAFGHLLDDWRAAMDPEIVRLIEQGQATSGVELAKVDQTRTAMWRSLRPILERCDALLTPTNTVTAPAIGGSEFDYDHVDEQGRLHGFDMTSPFNMLSFLPALSVPSGIGPDGLPTALQIIGRRHDDPTALRIGAALEQARPWPQWTPDCLSRA